ncbi:MAG: cell wall-binding repeat-containing protein [Acidimicrobiales bacterium]|nr:cell wall-binding repeat-containing protein [Acidimicrobiales bacterium]MYK70770.1 cell wall-binding repeat-containing protein [Acidimicrobiales bacterium]
MELCTRRLKRFASAVAACVLGLTALAVVHVGPAQAANTAAELLVDPADRISTVETGGVRPFSGRDRYETALRLAERFVHERGGLGSVSTVILASGEALADGVVTAGLAGHLAAPVLLTRPDDLPEGVADFIDHHGVSTVIVVGGASSVSRRVLRELTALETEPEVRRIAGADRFATAAAVAADFDSGSTWCATDDVAAVLVNGANDHLADVMAIGPLASARELPILLSRQNELPEAAAKYLRDRRTERVVIVGGTEAISDAVVSELLEAGVDEVERVAATRTASVETAMAQLMTVTCRHELEPTASIVALAGRGSVADAIAAGPVLGAGMGGSGPIPLLLAADPLPRAVSSFLARTPREIDGRKNHVLVVAIGGRSVIDETTMSAAVRAAASARPLTARITANAGESTLRISYSESLEVDGDGFAAKLRDLLYVNDVPAWIAGQPVVSSRTADPCETFSSLDVMLRHELEVGDTIELLPAEDWPSTNADRRVIRGASRTIPEPRPSFRGPSVEVIALPGATKVWISIKASEYRNPEAGSDGGITVNAGRIRVLAEDDTAVTVGQPARVRLDRFLGTALYSFDLQAGGGTYALAADDLVIVRNGLAVNASERRSGSRRAIVVEPQVRLGVAAVRVGPPNPGVDDSVQTIRPAEIATISKRAQASLGGSLNVVAKWSGSAAGAAGNAWEIHSTRADTAVVTPGAVEGDDPPDTQVWVDATRNLISIRHVNAPAGHERQQTYGELVQVLNSNRDFSRHFVAELTEPCEGDEKVVDLGEEGLTGTAEFTGGISSISFLVSFNDYVEAFRTDGTTVVGAGAGAVGELIDDVLGGLIDDYGQSVAGIPADQVEVAAPVPGKDVVFRFTTHDPEHAIAQTVNVRSKRIDLREGLAASYRPDDVGTADIDESVSAGRSLFVVSSRDSRLLSDLARGANSGG